MFRCSVSRLSNFAQVRCLPRPQSGLIVFQDDGSGISVGRKPVRQCGIAILAGMPICIPFLSLIMFINYFWFLP